MAEEDFLFKYMGHLNNLQQFIGDADCVVLPSYYNEGMNRSLMEALSMGIPIITTDNRGCRELVIDGKPVLSYLLKILMRCMMLFYGCIIFLRKNVNASRLKVVNMHWKGLV